MAFLAGKLERAFHRVNEALGDEETEAAMDAGTSAALREALKESVELLAIHADAGVSNDDAQHVRPPRARQTT